MKLKIPEQPFQKIYIFHQILLQRKTLDKIIIPMTTRTKNTRLSKSPFIVPISAQLISLLGAQRAAL